MPIVAETRLSTEWRLLGACLSEDPELFFPIENNEAAYADAKAVCRACPVRLVCLGDALDYKRINRHDAGVAGGTGPRERKKFLANNPDETNWTRRLPANPAEAERLLREARKAALQEELTEREKRTEQERQVRQANQAGHAVTAGVAA